jgi:hypothetical protein
VLSRDGSQTSQWRLSSASKDLKNASVENLERKINTEKKGKATKEITS